MIDKNLETLVKLFGNYKCSELEAPDAGVLFEKAFNKKYPEFYNENWFIEGIKIIRPIKIKIENFEKELNHTVALKNILLFAWQRIMALTEKDISDSFKQEIELSEKLTIETFKDKWTVKQKDFYSNTLKNFMQQNLYFISYTNRLAPIINDMYYEKICKKIPPPFNITDNDLNTKNLLAMSFYRWLKIKNLKKGFFDEESMRGSEPIPATVKSNIDRSNILIQLLDSASFTYDNNNWSFTEFHQYQNFKERKYTPRIFFFLIESTALPNDIVQVYPDYQDWYNEIKADKRVDFYTVNSVDSFSQVMKKLIDDIYFFSRQAIENVPID